MASGVMQYGSDGRRQSILYLSSRPAFEPSGQKAIEGSGSQLEAIQALLSSALRQQILTQGLSDVSSPLSY